MTKRNEAAATPRDFTAEDERAIIEGHGFSLGQKIKYAPAPGGSLTRRGRLTGASKDGSLVVEDEKTRAARCVTADRIKATK